MEILALNSSFGMEAIKSAILLEAFGQVFCTDRVLLS